MTVIQPLQPFDEHNRNLKSNVHPDDWQNPQTDVPYHLVVIGGGTAGLVTAAGAAGLGARVALVERELMGGDCLNVGCVPSKGLIGAARAIATAKGAGEFGLSGGKAGTVDFAQLMERMRAKRAQISPADSAQRFRELGVDVYFGDARFTGKQQIQVKAEDGETVQLEFKKSVIASGARASAPPIPGLETVPYLTNESLFSLTDLPPRLGIIGAGPIGCEMAQSFARFGSSVYLFERSPRILSREDEQAAHIVQAQFERDGVNLVLNADGLTVARKDDDSATVVTVERNGENSEFEVDELLVAVGRAPNVETLGLETVDVQYDRRGVKVNDYLQTTNPKIFAAGDVCSKYQFTHSADFQARIVIQNALFALGPIGKKRASDLIIPWATYTSPEIAHVGIYPSQADEQGIEIDTYTQSFEHIDRAILDGQEDGLVVVHTAAGSDKILGATVVAEHAGDLISEITVAMKNKIGLAGIGSTIHPYPTQAEAIRKLGDQYNRKKLTPLSLKILGALRWFNVGK